MAPQAKWHALRVSRHPPLVHRGQCEQRSVCSPYQYCLRTARVILEPDVAAPDLLNGQSECFTILGISCMSGPLLDAEPAISSLSGSFGPIR